MAISYKKPEPKREPINYERPDRRKYRVEKREIPAGEPIALKQYESIVCGTRTATRVVLV